MNSPLPGRTKFIATALILFSATVFGQDRSDVLDKWIFEPETSFDLLKYLSPKPVRTSALVQEYVRDSVFLHLRREYGDAAAIDGIYREALFLTEGRAAAALLAAAGGVIEHFKLGLRIPVLGVLNLPLTLESIGEFRLRYNNLPSSVLRDSAARSANDRDKLQHFFGSAYLAFVGRSDVLAECLGNGIEVSEESFVVGGRDDIRDRLANALGRRFGLLLLDDPAAMPSDVLGRDGAVR